MNRELLEQPFDKVDIRRRKGRGGVWEYVGVSNVIKRLNESFDGMWNFEIVSYEQVEDEILVLGKLSADGVVKMQFGGKQVARHKDDSIVCIADDYKAAASDCLKKAATQLGVALTLYDNKELDSEDGGGEEGNKDVLLGRIEKGEVLLAEMDGVDEPVIRKDYWEFETEFDKATMEQLNAYCLKLLEAYSEKANKANDDKPDPKSE